MNEIVRNLEPKHLWNYFADILEIPRPSKQEEKIAKYIVDYGNEHKLETITDEIGNILIRKPATPGYENRKTVCLQSHIDMVCEKNSDVQHDFLKDPIIAREENGWIKATGTTLGADDGIGIATQLALLAAIDIEHGPIECLFTIDEETGLTGAFGLKPGFLKSDILLNLDSEDEGQLFIGCAGGKDTVAKLSYKTAAVPENYLPLRVTVSGLKGGHSGDDINKGLGNAVKVLNRLVWNLSKKFNVCLAGFDAGNLRNAIAREGFADLVIPENNLDTVKQYINDFNKEVKSEYSITEPDFIVAFEDIDLPAKVLDQESQEILLNTLYICPHGVIAMSASIPNFVETSTNLASVKFMENNEILITTSQRSSIESAKQDVCDMVASVFKLAGANYNHSDGYPGWAPNPNSEIVEITKQSYIELFKEDPKVLAVHAGLECGLIGEKYPDMDMISYGPEIKGAHSPDERIQIESVKRFWDLTLDVLKKIPIKSD